MDEKPIIKIASIAVIIIALTILYISSFYNYLLFHVLAEFFSISVAFTLFLLVWNSRKYVKNNYLILVGIAYFFVGFLDILHTLGYTGMNVFTDYDFYGNQLWIASRFIESITLLIGFYFLRRKESLKPHYVFLSYYILTTIATLSIFYWKVFPVCFIPGSGQTTFKLISEYVIIFILMVSLFLLFKNRYYFEAKIQRYLMLSICFTIISELSFTFYISNYGFSNLIGHYFKIFSFYLIYKSIIETGIVKPYDLIFKEIIDYQSQLASAKEAAEAANKLKGEFLSNISHEIRTPLNSMLGFCSILLENEQDADKAEKLRIISKSGEHLLFLINEILDFSKADSNKIVLENTSYSLRKTLKDILAALEVKAIEKNLLLELQIDDHAPDMLIGDPYRVKQVLLNIVGNAIKFTEKGFIRISCYTQDNTLYIAVKDTGIGIPKEKQELIFNSFEQADSSTARQYGGTGLGLAISKKLVELMNGNITLESKEGLGSEFFIEIPIIYPKKDKLIAEYYNSLLVKDTADNRLKSKLLYLVSLDTPEYIFKTNTLSKSLDSSIAIIQLMPYTEDVLKLFNQVEFDMLLIDSDISEAVSREVFKAFKEDFRLRHIPVARISQVQSTSFSISVLNCTDNLCPVSSSCISNEAGECKIKIDDYLSRRQSYGEGLIKAWTEKAEKDLGMSDVVFMQIAQMPLELKTLEKAISSGISESIAECAHSIKGACGNVRMEEFYQLALQIEAAANNSDPKLPAVKEAYSKMLVIFNSLPKQHTAYRGFAFMDKKDNISLAKKNVLIVEDNEMNQKLMSFIMDEMGFSYKLAANGKEALKLLDSHEFDLILMDSHMPIMNGLETLTSLKNNPSLSDIPVIIISADLNKDIIDRYVKLGCNDYIIKPINRREVIEKLNGILGL